MNQEEILELLRRWPSVHQLVYGAYIQETILVDDKVFAIPLQALGFEAQATYLGKYNLMLTNQNADLEALNQMIEQGSKAFPTIAIVCILDEDDSPENLQEKCNLKFERANKILSWISGDIPTPFGTFTQTRTQNYFGPIIPHSNFRQRLGFGNTGENFQNQVINLTNKIKEDEHFAFGLSIFQDALREQNPKFKIARFFSCLECFAYKIKSKERPSRKAVKYLLDLEEGAFSEVNVAGKKIRYDVIEIAGRVRDRLFHGVEFDEDDLNAENKHIFELYAKHPENIAFDIQGYCELEIARWSNGSSRGLTEPEN